MFEIWPWKGALTKHIINLFNYSYLFEKDNTFANILDQINPTKIYWWDFLQQDLGKIIIENNLKKNEIMVIWNIPYYITSPIFRKVFIENQFDYWIFMIQKEVWEKIKHDAEKKSFLWWLLNYNHKVEYLKTVSAKYFTPKPKVDSCLVQVVSNWKKPFSYEKMFIFLDNVSKFKRKTIWKISKMLEKKGIYYKIPESLMSKRLEQLTRDDISSILK